MQTLILHPAFRNNGFVEFLIADFLTREAHGWYFSDGEFADFYEYWADLYVIREVDKFCEEIKFSDQSGLPLAPSPYKGKYGRSTFDLYRLDASGLEQSIFKLLFAYPWHDHVKEVFSSDLCLDSYFKSCRENPENQVPNFVSLLEKNPEISTFSRLSIWWNALAIADCNDILITGNDIEILARIRQYLLTLNYHTVGSVHDLVYFSPKTHSGCNGALLKIDGESAFQQSNYFLTMHA
jgi:hypothetical protein